MLLVEEDEPHPSRNDEAANAADPFIACRRVTAEFCTDNNMVNNLVLPALLENRMGQQSCRELAEPPAEGCTELAQPLPSTDLL